MEFLFGLVAAAIAAAVVLPPFLGKGRWGYFAPRRTKLEAGVYRGGTVPHYPLKPMPQTVWLGITANVLWSVVTLGVFVPAGATFLLVMGAGWGWMPTTPSLETSLSSAGVLVASHVMFGLSLSGGLWSLFALISAVQVARRRERWSRFGHYLYFWQLAHHAAAVVPVIIISVFAPAFLVGLLGPVLGVGAAALWKKALVASYPTHELPDETLPEADEDVVL